MKKLTKVKDTRVIGLRTTQKGVNPKDHVGAKKVSLSFIPPTMQVFAAQGYAVGARKYGPYNWRIEPILARGYLEAAKRHIEQLLDGEDFDPIEGVHHGAFILSTVGIYLDAMVHGNLIDDRPVPGRGGEMINKLSDAYTAGGSPEQLRECIEEIVNSKRDSSNDIRRTTKKGGRNARR